MIEFFNTQYYIDREPEAVFKFLSDFRNYFEQLPEFKGAGLSSDDSPPAPGKVFVVRTHSDAYKFETHVQIMRLDSPQLFAYEYSYQPRRSDEEGEASVNPREKKEDGESPMPWTRAEVTLQLQAYREGTQVRAQMHVFGVAGFFARWKVTALKAACARQQPTANQNLVQLAERSIPKVSPVSNHSCSSQAPGL